MEQRKLCRGGWEATSTGIGVKTEPITNRQCHLGKTHSIQFNGSEEMRQFFMVSFVFVSSVAVAAEPAFQSTFDGDARPKNWGVNFGHWEPENGVLVCRQLEKDDHAAASRLRVPMSDGVVTARVKLDGAKQFHIGFDPAKGTLDKKGHLYSVVMSPNQVAIKKHRDKADKASKDKVLKAAKYKAVGEGWVDVVLTTKGNEVTVKLSGSSDDGATIKNFVVALSGSDDTFHVKKPTVVFRSVGGDVLIDELKVEVKKP